MNTLPAEMVNVILGHADSATRPLLRRVCAKWRALMVSQPQWDRPDSYGRAVCTKGICLWRHTCVGTFMDRLIRRRRWQLFEWVMTTYLECDGCAPTTHCHACNAAAADGDLARLQMFSARGYAWSPDGTCRAAARYGHGEVIAWALGRSHCQYARVCTEAAKGGHLALLKQLVEKGFTCDERALEGAAKYGHIDVLEWLKAQGHWSGEYRAICMAAAKGGHIDVIEWVLANEPIWPVPDLSTYVLKGIGADLAAKAARRGHLWLLQWLRAPYDAKAYVSAAKGGHLHVLEWLTAQGHPKDTRRAFAAAAERDRVRIMDWLYRDCLGDTTALLDPAVDLCANMAAGGQLRALAWLLGHGCCCAGDGDLCVRAAAGGQTRILQWLRNRGYTWTAEVCAAAASEICADTALWLHLNGCPWDADTCIAIVRRNDLYDLRQVREYGCPWDARVCRKAAKFGFKEILVWAHENGCPWDAGTCAALAARNDLDMLQWVRDRGCPWDARTSDRAAQHDNWGLFAWARNNGCPWDGGDWADHYL